MKRRFRSLGALSLVTAVVAVAACSSSATSTGTSSGSSPASSSGTSASAQAGGTITIDAGTAPLSADQGLDFTTQGTELYSVVNTPLLTFQRGVQGVGGSKIIPGLAEALPTVTNGGKTYTFMLRPGLKYSNGTAIKASDVTYALERDIKIPWQAASFVSAYIAGGTAYANGKAKTISGITTDDATGKIVVNLVAPFAPIEDIFALAGTAPVPPTTPMKNLANTGTIGDGPYMWGPITPNQSYTLVQEPELRRTRPRARARGQDHLPGQRQRDGRRRSGAQQPGRRVRPRRHPARVPPAAGADAGEQPVPGGPDELDLLLLVRRHPEAVQQPVRPSGRDRRAR